MNKIHDKYTYYYMQMSVKHKMEQLKNLFSDRSVVRSRFQILRFPQARWVIHKILDLGWKGWGFKSLYGEYPKEFNI